MIDVMFERKIIGLMRAFVRFKSVFLIESKIMYRKTNYSYVIPLEKRLGL